jgi:hypothetical protein
MKNQKSEDISRNIIIIENHYHINDFFNNSANFKLNLIIEDLTYIENVFEKYVAKPYSINNAVDLLESCKTCLLNIKRKLGDTDITYMELSTTIVSKSQEMIVTVVNNALKRRQAYVDYANWKKDPFSNMLYAKKFGTNVPNKITGNSFINFNDFNVPMVYEYALDDLEKVIKLAWSAIKKVEEYEIIYEQKAVLTKNKEEIKDLYKELDDSVYFFNYFIIKKWLTVVIILAILDIIFLIVTKGEQFVFFLPLGGIYCIFYFIVNMKKIFAMLDK